MTGSRVAEFLTTLAEQRVIGIIRTTSAADAVVQGQRLVGLGLRLIEISLTTPDALHAIEQLAGLSDVIVGVGTSLDEAATISAADAGAAFALSPCGSPEMVMAARRRGMAAIPAAFTPTEAVAALEAGADAVKLFPAAVYGPAGLAAMLEAIPHVPVVPTGGVRLVDAEAWFNAGAHALGLGGGLHRATDDEVRSLLLIGSSELGEPGI